MPSDPLLLERMREHAAKIFQAALDAVEPCAALSRACRFEDPVWRVGDEEYDLSEVEKIVVVGAGKACAPMAVAIERMLGARITNGLVNVKYGHTDALARIRLVEAGHPVPDENGRKGAEEILNIVRDCGDRDLIICLISGGGSALLPLPAQNMSLSDKQRTIEVLMACGATIHEINAIRKHTSAIKGGRLAEAAHPARLVTLILSDVVGDDLDVIASGPTVGDSSSFSDCLAVVQRYGIRDRLPGAVWVHLTEGAAGRRKETPTVDEDLFRNTHNLLIGTNMDALLAASRASEELGYRTLILSSMVEGETRHVAAVHAAIAREIRKSGHPISAPACILSGGETTVTLTGKGRGGRNQEFSLAAAVGISGIRDVVAASVGTDGTDGPTDAAGAIADSQTVERACHLGLSALDHLTDNNAYPYFETLGDLWITGPTRTNVMDMRIVLVG